LKLLVGFAPGGAVDIVARAIGQQIAPGLGQPVVIDNRPGAGTNIAMRTLIDSAPDGHTLMLTANSIAANQTLYHPQPYDMARDFTPIALVGRVPVVLAANPQSAIDSIAKLIAASKAAPNSVSYGSPGNGSTPHLATELFERAAGIQMNHVPYKGGAPAITDVLGGHLPLVAVNALEVQAHARTGKLRVLAALSPARSPIFPDVPTIAESGFPGFEASVWYGLVGPAGLPAPIVARLHAEVQKALASPELRERLAGAGGEVLPGPVERFTALLTSERTRYDKLIREARIQPD
jgi:tripartite-type tricarboxylate transporter receptor subunit TctC